MNVKVTDAEMGSDFTDLQRFLWRFRMVANEGQTMLRGFAQTGDAAKVLNNDLLFSLCNQALIIVCKFLEIWDEFGSLAKDSDLIKGLRGALQPYVDRIRVWKGLEQFRNTALAHPYLTKDKRLIGPWQLIASEKAPSYHAESLLLLHIVHFVVLTILCAFPKEYDSIRAHLAAPEALTTAGPGIKLGTEIRAELENLAMAADSKVSALGVQITGPTVAEFAAAMGN
jgi:hypothetical protein